MALPLLVLLLVGVPVLEVWLLIQVGQEIGALWTVVVLLAIALLGGLLVRQQGRQAWSALNGAFASGKMPAAELADAALVLVGGVLLLLPGFATDIIGLFLLLPLTRPLARRLLSVLVDRQIQQLPVHVRRPGDHTVIRGETVEQPGQPAEPAQPSSSSGPLVIRGEVDDGRA